MIGAARLGAGHAIVVTDIAAMVIAAPRQRSSFKSSLIGRVSILGIANFGGAFFPAGADALNVQQQGYAFRAVSICILKAKIGDGDIGEGFGAQQHCCRLPVAHEAETDRVYGKRWREGVFRRFGAVFAF